MHPFWVCKLEHFFSSHLADQSSISCVPACVLDGIYTVCSTGDLSGASRVPVLGEPMFWEKRWLISQQTHRSYIASGLRVDLIKYQNQASVVLMFGCASPSDPVLDPVCCSLRSWCLPSPHSPKHHLKPPHLLPEGSTLRRGRQWPGLGLLGVLVWMLNFIVTQGKLEYLDHTELSEYTVQDERGVGISRRVLIDWIKQKSLIKRQALVPRLMVQRLYLVQVSSSLQGWKEECVLVKLLDL